MYNSIEEKVEDTMITGIILAAGQGSRMKSNVQKQYMELNGKPVLYYSLYCMQNSKVNQIILVVGEQDIEYCRCEIVEKYGFDKVKWIIAGGAERYQSVQRALSYIKQGYVMIHDGARPFITNQMIDDSINCVKITDACSVGMPVKDTIKIVDGKQYGVDTPERQYVWQVQTPQTFKTEKIKQAYDCMQRELEHENLQPRRITDDTMLVELYIGCKCKMIEGNYSNIKITTPEDMRIAISILNGKNKNVDNC